MESTSSNSRRASSRSPSLRSLHAFLCFDLSNPSFALLSARPFFLFELSSTPIPFRGDLPLVFWRTLISVGADMLCKLLFLPLLPPLFLPSSPFFFLPLADCFSFSLLRCAVLVCDAMDSPIIIFSVVFFIIFLISLFLLLVLSSVSCSESDSSALARDPSLLPTTSKLSAPPSVAPRFWRLRVLGLARIESSSISLATALSSFGFDHGGSEGNSRAEDAPEVLFSADFTATPALSVGTLEVGSASRPSDCLFPVSDASLRPPDDIITSVLSFVGDVCFALLSPLAPMDAECSLFSSYFSSALAAVLPLSSFISVRAAHS
mmetsp:Transcript_53900/g.161275  ORF Transcript_53900/g.161275 Transcript_53900/m.161275 type:complete len:320 (+) Transcript_53900:1385-2344(+)